MVDPVRALRGRLQTAMIQLGIQAEIEDGDIHRSAHADYQADIAMRLGAGGDLKPRDTAAEIVSRLAPDDELAAAEASGPGFINLTLNSEYLAKQAGHMLADPRLGVSKLKVPELVVVDYSAPNLAKEMHVGHLRSTIIGDALARVFEFLGYTVIRHNHIGDWGTPFGMLIEQMADQRTANTDAGVRELSKFYRAARVNFERDPAFAQRARQRVVALQSKDPDTLELWKQLVAVTLDHIETLYDKLDVTLRREDAVGESYYDKDLPSLVAELQEQGLAQTSEAALCIFPPGFKRRDGEAMPLIVRKQDGGFGYAATDLAALRYRLKTLGADQVLYVVGAPQRQHLAMVIAAARMAGWVRETDRVEHVAFGSVLGADKKMLKSRSGESVSLDMLLHEAVERARRLVAEKSPSLDEQEHSAIARAVGVGAVKYADLVSDRIKDYVFSWERMLAFEGNTGPYLMYAHSRICSILRKAKEDGLASESSPGTIVVEAPAERLLVLELVQFASVVHRLSDTLQPHRLCEHLFDVARAFSAFYQNCPVLWVDEPVRSSRISLSVLTARVLAKGLSLLGIRAPERM